MDFSLPIVLAMVAGPVALGADGAGAAPKSASAPQPHRAVCLDAPVDVPACGPPRSNPEWSEMKSEGTVPVAIVPAGYPAVVTRESDGELCGIDGVALTRAQLLELLSAYPPSQAAVARWREAKAAQISATVSVVGGAAGGGLPGAEWAAKGWTDHGNATDARGDALDGALCSYNAGHAAETARARLEARAIAAGAGTSGNPPLSAWAWSRLVYDRLERPIPAEPATWRDDVAALQAARMAGMDEDAIVAAIAAGLTREPAATIREAIDLGRVVPAPASAPSAFEDDEDW